MYYLLIFKLWFVIMPWTTILVEWLVYIINLKNTFIYFIYVLILIRHI